MSNRPALVGSATDGPTFCWTCNAQLRRAPGRGRGLFYFVLVADPDGNRHRIHKDCLSDAEMDGAKEVRDGS